ncbi:hypothetical protein BURK_002290 [Burkholderia sp. SJ98]|uniref:hypothetical protein n=1 Tax=Caballeronia zhejiangensis TaxID=871203 RepID=UPI00025BC7F1|nr:hypothetical protein [Caballeronia zhejiangensis]EKS73259.1 hypothetical protein BURK_002290 [Burkholderia sp. SJ98]
MQPWPWYETLFESFDYLGVLGRSFIDRLSPEFQSRTVALSLPVLDSYHARTEPAGNTVLFVLQKDVPPGIVDHLSAEIEALSGKKFDLRAHPEHVSNYDALKQ